MCKIIQKLHKFGFHDACITGIEVDKSQICLVFLNGVYKLDVHDKETSLTKKCVLKIIFKKEYNFDIFNVIDIVFVSKKGRRFIDSEDILSIAKNENLIVQNIYWSDFNNTILIECGNSKGGYYIKFEDCSDISYQIDL